LDYNHVRMVSKDCPNKSKDMIITLFLNFIYLLLQGLIALLPTGHLPTQMTTAFVNMFGLLNTFNYVIPIVTIVEVVVLTLAIDGAIMLWHFINWAIRKVPGMQ